MKVVAKTLLICSLVAMVCMVAPAQSFAQEKMTMKDYKIELQEWIEKENGHKAEIAKVDADIESLKSQIAGVEGEISGVWGEVYSAIGVTEEEVNAFRGELDGLDSELGALAALSPEELFKRRKEIDAIEARIAELKENKIYILTEMRDKVSGLEVKVAQLRTKMPKGMYDEYTVNRGDYLWRIARKSYDDPMQWVRIYSYNRDQIKDPDMIYPEQIFKIHRENGPNEYLVSKGDNLSKICGSIDVLGDPTKWRQVYEANKDVVGDEPSLIYPYQVLKIPTN